MLNLNRRPHEAIVITCPDGTELQVIVQWIDGNVAHIGLIAPKSYRIDRYEIHHRRKREAAGEALQGQEPRGPNWIDYRERQ